MEEYSLSKKRHIDFLLRMLRSLPSPYASQDSNHLTLIYFVISGLDLLGYQFSAEERERIIRFVYSLQLLPDKDNENNNDGRCGFRGGTYYGGSFNPDCHPRSLHIHDHSHIAMTYTGLAVLRICGDDFSRINKKAIIGSLKRLQKEDGSFSPVANGSENDMRFVYCACAISYMLNDFSGFDQDKAVKYILLSQSYDFGIGQGPGQESHGGSTYCAVAALQLMNRLQCLPHKEELVQWCIHRHISGFQGRINKDADTCYSFWIGATLSLLDSYQWIDFSLVRSHSYACQQSIGGFSKIPDAFPDLMHTYLAICGLSIGECFPFE